MDDLGMGHDLLQGDIAAARLKCELVQDMHHDRPFAANGLILSESGQYKQNKDYPRSTAFACYHPDIEGRRPSPIAVIVQAVSRLLVIMVIIRRFFMRILFIFNSMAPTNRNKISYPRLSLISVDEVFVGRCRRFAVSFAIPFLAGSLVLVRRNFDFRIGLRLFNHVNFPSLLHIFIKEGRDDDVHYFDRPFAIDRA